MPYVSSLALQGDAAVRRDYCPPCWQLVDAGAAASVIYWKGKVPSEKAAEHKDFDRAFSLLRTLVHSGVESDRAGGYVLALYLARCRLLHLKGDRQIEGQQGMLYEHILSEEMIWVPKISSQNLNIGQVREILAEIVG